MKNATKHYLIAALWSSTGEDSEPLDKTYSVDDFHPDAVAKADLHVSYFIDRAGPWLKEEDQTEEQIGHDLWLTRNGHGAGFWDRDLPDGHGEILTKICKAMGGSDCYVGDNGKVYLT